jgi:S-adenosylmethionine-diacylglycerol 3-amino-3-carboxypropyl transferase
MPALLQRLPNWVAEAAALPLAFAQVREDPVLDLWVAARLPSGSRAIMVASGGCTAAMLAAAASTIAELQIVDANPAQLALTRLKLHLLKAGNVTMRFKLLGHAPLGPGERQAALIEELSALQLPMDALGPLEAVAAVGPDYAGRYEFVFAELRSALSHRQAEIESILNLTDPREQGARVGPLTPLGIDLDQALDSVLALPNLVSLFGEEATQNPVEPFSRHFARRIRHVLGTLPARQNPYLWQMLLGRYPQCAAAPWLTMPAPFRLPELTWSCGSMNDFLEAAPGTFDFVQLSNILDWLSPENAGRTLELAADALRPGGWLLARQLNSTLEIPRIGDRFEWLTQEAGDLHAQDRSFFYRQIHLGRKR